MKQPSVGVESCRFHALSPEPSMTALATSQLLGSSFKSLQMWPADGAARTLLYIVPRGDGSCFFVPCSSFVLVISIPPSVDVVEGGVGLKLVRPDWGVSVKTSTTSLHWTSVIADGKNVEI